MAKTLDTKMATPSVTNDPILQCNPDEATVLLPEQKPQARKIRAVKNKTSTKLPSIDVTENDVRVVAEGSFEKFIRLVSPRNVFGHVHIELCQWLSRKDARDHQLVLMPRDHGKSRYAAFYALWEITRNPAIRILYISSTANLAEKQLGFIKDIMQSSIYRRYWPEMTHVDEGKRKKWTNSEIMVDHPKRVEEGIRDPTVMIAGLEKSITGLHFDLAILDDVVVQENAYTEEGRDKVKRQYSLLASIEGADAKEVAVGTRYHPADLYANILAMEYVPVDKNGEEGEPEKIYEIFERQVEDAGDGSGQFLWPTQISSTGQTFGFNRNILAKKKAKYIDQTQFRAQYYNDPNDSSSAAIGREKFQYFDPAFLKYDGRHWHIQGRRLNIVAAVDFSYSTKLRADYTAIAIVGMDSDRRYYVLEIDRFKTSEIKDYYTHILDLYKKWDFRKLIAETSAAQQAIVNELKSSYIVPNGIMLSIVEHKPTRHEGTKEERLRAILEPRYQNLSVWHYRGGNCQVLEDELVMQHPPHDDCKDAVASALDHLVPPAGVLFGKESLNVLQLKAHPKFGGLGGRY
jgi:phage terminase large subunit-like protein